MNPTCVNCRHWDASRLNSKQGASPCGAWSAIEGRAYMLLQVSGRGLPLMTPSDFGCNAHEPNDSAMTSQKKKATKKKSKAKTDG